MFLNPPYTATGAGRAEAAGGAGQSAWRAPARAAVARGLVPATDITIFAGAFLFAYLLRFDFAVPPDERANWLAQAPLVVVIQYAALRACGIHRFIWRYIGIAELGAFVLAAALFFVPALGLRLLLPDALARFRVPLSVTFVDTLLAFGGVLAVRVLGRGLHESGERRSSRAVAGAAARKPVVLVGAGRAGVLAAKEIRERGDLGLDIRGFVDDDPEKLGSVIQGVRVLGTTADLPRLVEALSLDHVVLTLARAPRREIRRLVHLCEQIEVKVRIIPGIDEIIHQKLEVSSIRDVQIEDLLGREPVRLEEDTIRAFVTGKTVMVTGAGGSIGSELVRQVSRFRPSCLLLVERAEFSLFTVDQELGHAAPDLVKVPLVADVGDAPRMRALFAEYRPEVVLHAAAHKHVPMMETNAAEAVKNNVLGTRVLGELAGEYGVGVFVLVSTDKAVRPTSVMGATKRVAELVVQDLNRQFATRYLAVRFGNVIGSAGSVALIFQQQIRRGGPVTVTHPDMVRYFMTIPEAAQLVLQAGAIGQGSEIFVLDMGEPVRILDLAKDAIRLSGLKPFEDIDIAFTGTRPGEKLFEELEMTDENLTKTRHPKIYIGKIAEYQRERVRGALRRLGACAESGDELKLRAALGELLPEARLEPCGRGASAGAVEAPRAAAAAAGRWREAV